MKLSPAQNFKKAAEKGFTLIELLVVIGILGILAAALVATIDPFEQLQKATDSRRQNMTVEFLNANIRYFTTQEAFPWDDAELADLPDCSALGTTGIDGLPLSDAGLEECIEALAITGELKESFSSNSDDLEQVYVSWDPADYTDMVVCYAPVSRSQKGADLTRYTSPQLVGGSLPMDPDVCPDPESDPGDCYWCTQ